MLLVLTSNGCGHCHMVRGDGQLNNGKQLMNYKFLKPLCDKLNIFNIHYSSMRGYNEDIMEVIKVSLNGTILNHDKYYKSEDKTMFTRTYTTDNTAKNTTEIVDIKTDWEAFVKTKIVDKLKNYTYYFPCFIVVKTEDWNNSLKTPGSQIFGLTNAGYTVNKDGEIGIYKNGISLNQRSIGIDKLVNNVLEKKESFIPRKIEDIDKYVKPKKEKEKEKKIEKEPELVIKKY